MTEQKIIDGNSWLSHFRNLGLADRVSFSTFCLEPLIADNRGAAALHPRKAELLTSFLMIGRQRVPDEVVKEVVRPLEGNDAERVEGFLNDYNAGKPVTPVTIEPWLNTLLRSNVYGGNGSRFRDTYEDFIHAHLRDFESDPEFRSEYPQLPPGEMETY
jgi:hypothetical protein